MNLSIPSGDLETYQGFIDESRDHLDSIEQKVLVLMDAVDPDSVNSLFRALHTIKGIAGFLALTDIQRLSHRLESLFDAIRQGALAVDQGLVQAALGNLDHLVLMIHNLDQGLAGRQKAADGSFEVCMAEVDYLADFEALGHVLAKAEALGAAGTASAGPSINAEPAAPETELITAEMRLCFVKESEELLEATEQIFLRLVDAPADADAIAQAFRNIHSFKGNCGFFGYSDMERLSHRLETVLEGVRGSGAAMNLSVLETTLQCLDVFRSAMAGLGTEGAAVVPDLPGWLARLDALEGKAPPAETAPKPGQAPPAAFKAAAKETKRDIRVDLGKLDTLMDLVGELVISTGMVFNHPIIKGSNAPDLEKISHQLMGVVAELQGVALGVRMVPIEGTFRKMTRLVHDLSSKVGKKVRLDFLGEATEVDKTVVDLIADPLVHMIRNSVDHGLEAPAERTAAGKDAMGVVTLEAGQEGGEILINVRDDGRGMSRERILGKAIERGLVEGDGGNLSDSEVFQFIFQPGFSTAEAITSTSGRGVGMDVVKSNIDKLGGRISITSRQGEGSAIQLRIPLTLSIIDGMMVQVGESLFILPLTAVRESISPGPKDVFTLMDGQEMLKLRGRTFPILRLGDLYGIAGTRTRSEEGLLIQVEARESRFCLAVDDLIGQRQVVVKALPGFMNSVPGTNSCSILDNGEIALILDVSGLGALSHKPGGEPRRDWKPRMAQGAVP